MTLAARALAAVYALPRRSLWLLVRMYQLFISPVIPPACRYHPSCSRYAAEALLTHGALRGAWLGARRLSRCHPWAAGGPDPVPPLPHGPPAVLDDRASSLRSS